MKETCLRNRVFPQTKSQLPQKLNDTKQTVPRKRISPNRIASASVTSELHSWPYSFKCGATVRVCRSIIHKFPKGEHIEQTI